MMGLMKSKRNPSAAGSDSLPDRFRTSPRVLMIDLFMNLFIKAGGILIILSVSAIFVFIAYQTIPLFQGAKVDLHNSVSLASSQDALFLGVDEWGEIPFTIHADGQIRFWNAESGNLVKEVDGTMGMEGEISATRFRADKGLLVIGTSLGQYAVHEIRHRADFSSGERIVKPEVQLGAFALAGEQAHPITQIDLAKGEQSQLLAFMQKSGDESRVIAVTFSQKRSLMGKGKLVRNKTIDLTASIQGRPRRLIISGSADTILVSNNKEEILYFACNTNTVSFTQSFRPFFEATRLIKSMGFLSGGGSVVFTSDEGNVQIYSLFVPEGRSQRLFGLTKNMEDLPSAAEVFSASRRNKAFLLGSNKELSLRYATTGDIRWQKLLPFDFKAAVVGAKYDRFFVLDTQGRLHQFRLNDPHPEASLRAFFRKIWYEGYTHPKYEWQSSGGSDDFEPKLSLVPLIVGTLKGTFYAMIFAFPIALLAAIYTAEFSRPKVRTIVKPLMEIMASIPSVVLGFLAALWLAPHLELRVPSFIMMVILTPTAALVFGAIWGRLPQNLRRYVPVGYEWVVLLPLLISAAFIGWWSGPIVENTFFSVESYDGSRIADFRLWVSSVLGLAFEQRNAMVVGIAMGFAVIPILFTIAEDAIHNVPKTLRTASLALGASRWQTVWKVVLPVASGGIFSAAIIALGRAVGETMIVVMATGNTPVMDWNIFNGMRTLSANIAVELPEAPQHGTLYRTLFLGGSLLFLMTFVLNTGAEIVRQRIREKYRNL